MDNHSKVEVKIVRPTPLPMPPSKLTVVLKLEGVEAVTLAKIIGELKGITEENAPNLLKYYREVSLVFKGEKIKLFSGYCEYSLDDRDIVNTLNKKSEEILKNANIEK